MMIRVQYDAYNRNFSMLEHGNAGLRDGETYVVMDFSRSGIESVSALTITADKDDLYESAQDWL